jgi:type II secretory pathway component GspD/PulD (secretin)
MRKGKKFSVNFNEIPVRDVVTRLSFMSGVPFHVRSGDAERLVSISVQEATLNEIVDRLSQMASVKIKKGQGPRVR